MSRTSGALLALELADVGLEVAGGPALAGLAPSPGWAVVEPDGIRVGREAAERIRLNPRLAHRRFWGELEAVPLPRPFPRGLSAADLAYAHLGAVWSEAEQRLGGVRSRIGGRLLVAPGSFTVEQLGLVLGIAESLERPFTGVVDSAVAAASALAPEDSVVLDLELCRAVATEVVVVEHDGEPRWVRGRVRAQQEAGWNALLDTWARSIGRAFVATTRFDPLHAAASEQRLYSMLTEWLDAVRERESIEAAMQAGDREHRIVLTRREVATAAEPVYARIAELARSLVEPGGEGAPRLLVSDRLRRAPGMTERLRDEGFTDPTELAAGAALEGALRHADRIHQPSAAAPRWVTELGVGQRVPVGSG